MASQRLKEKVQSASSVGKFADPVIDSAREIWLAGLGAFSMAQKEGGKIVGRGSELFDKLVAEGGKLEKSMRRTADAKAADVRGGVEDRTQSARRQIKSNLDKIETVFEDRVARVLARLGVPSADEIHNLTDRVAALSAEIAAASRNTAKQAAQDVDVFHLLPKDEDWTVRLEGTEEDLSVHDTKDAALVAAREIAHARQPSRLVVHRSDGTIQTSYSYEDAD